MRWSTIEGGSFSYSIGFLWIPMDNIECLDSDPSDPNLDPDSDSESNSISAFPPPTLTPTPTPTPPPSSFSSTFSHSHFWLISF